MCLAFCVREKTKRENSKRAHPDSPRSLQVQGSSEAQAFPGANFAGPGRSEDTPVIVSGHSNIRSLKVPAGQCATLFDQPGYNEYAAGQMLQVHGPMVSARFHGRRSV